MVCRREWRVIGGAVAGHRSPVGAIRARAGTEPLLSYLDMLRKGPSLAALLEPKPDQLHSLRAFWTLLVPQPPSRSRSTS